MLDDAGISLIKQQVNKFNLDRKFKDYPAISAQIMEEDLKSLPLDKSLSKKIYKTWDRGNATPLYDKLEK
ncbi:MAG: hypothetical protein HQK83_09075 [Fibrobacteria bacterium]|nr:hypothetical protein [Fibrobacteria bacterium]